MVASYSSEHARFSEDGYVMVRGLLTARETATLLSVARDDPALRDHAYDRLDAEGRSTRLTAWYEPGEDSFGLLCRTARIVDRMTALIGDEVWHYHSKLMQKEPRVGGAWEWHQDYGYWYEQGFMSPDMASVFIALDGATRENGCLQVLKGSHRFGRITHGVAGSQIGADRERVDAAIARCELVHCEMAPGDALFFHSNLLHRSDANRSEKPRWSVICCYAAKANSALRRDPRLNYKPLVRIEDAAFAAAPPRGVSGDIDFNTAQRDSRVVNVR